MAEPVNALSKPLFEQLQHDAFVLLTTVDADTGAPYVNALSWVYAVTPDTIRFAVDARSRIISNVQHQPQVAASFFAAGSFHSLNGKATLVAESLPDVPLKLACFDITVASVRDAMFYGSRVSVQPEIEKNYDKRAADKLDGQVFAAMKKA